MEKTKIKLFDTTLRDGTQGEKISLSAEDKLRIARRLDEFGMDYIEGGWPMSNPRDVVFFQKAAQTEFKHARLVAFGSTMRVGHSPEQDPNLQALLQAHTPAVSIFGKSWLLHVNKALRISPEDNLNLITESIAFLKAHGKEVIYDAEHFFDGFKDNPSYALQTLLAAQRAGADVIVLCDTNGGSLPSEVVAIIQKVKPELSVPLGIHAHNDSDLAVANTIVAVQNGCVHVQGTINGYGERCGNANLCSVIPDLQLKGGFYCVPEENLSKLTALSYFVSEVANLSHPDNLPFVGKSAFAHKGGIHVSAVSRDASTYEHVAPEKLGNERRVLVSDLSGKSNILYKADELNINLDQEKVPEIVEKLKHLEYDGYQFEAAEGSLELLMRKINGELKDFFNLKGFRVLIEKNESEEVRAEATIRVLVNGQMEHTAAEGNGPVHALDNALRKALTKFFPEISQMHLSDYKVRVLNGAEGTAAKVRVLIDSTADGASWSTVGVSENIIEASWQALTDSISYYLLRRKQRRQND
ncbi:MAG: citramalate synthase [candidate division KSB1 bacterium]|nr:citramalate synthase [candidate division KSB1 bacterium]